MVVPDEATAIRIANDTKYGLGGSIYTRDIKRGRRIAEQLEAGMVFINHPAWISDDTCPSGESKNPDMAGRPDRSASKNSSTRSSFVSLHSMERPGR
jgi:acyl-CoA reductase-like NAD-dependent aldehyde dehydrogenase